MTIAQKLIEGEAVVCVTSDSEAVSPKRWLAARVRINTERSVCGKLNQLGYEAYVPSQEESRQWSDRSKIIHRVLIPMIVFVNVKKEDELRLLELSFMNGFLKSPGSKERSTPIPNDEIERLKFIVQNAKGNISFDNEGVDVGDDVKVVKGPLKDLIGKVLFINNKKSSSLRVKVTLMGSVCIEINEDCLLKI